MERMDRMHRWGTRVPNRRGTTLIEGLVASVVLALVAAGASMALGIGVGAQRDAQRQLLAGIAAEQQISTIMSAAYSETSSFAGVEEVGALLTPPRPTSSGSLVRDPMSAAFADFGRTTTVTAETRTFATYNNFSVPGWKIKVTVTDATGRVLADLERFRAQEVEP